MNPIPSRAHRFVGFALVLSAWLGAPGLRAAGTFLEPPDGKVYFGFFFRDFDTDEPAWGDSRPFASRFKDAIDQELGGKRPSLFGVFQSWQNKDGVGMPFANLLKKIERFQDVIGGASVPVVAWDSEAGASGHAVRYTGITTKDVAAGRLDEFLHQYARDVKAYGKPLLFRPVCHEMNGSWNRHCSPLANPALTTLDYVKAWRHVVTIFRQEGARNAGWVWNAAVFPVGLTRERVDRNLEAYYPGDDYVDWMGADFYDQGNPLDPRQNPLIPAVYLDAPYAMALRHNKPFLLGEWGIRHPASRLTPAQHEAWLNTMFNYVETHPKIKGILYFNYKEQGKGRLGVKKVIKYPDGEVTYFMDVNDGDFRLIAEGRARYRKIFAQRIHKGCYVAFDEAGGKGAAPAPAKKAAPPGK
jgi:hypothetical protein